MLFRHREAKSYDHNVQTSIIKFKKLNWSIRLDARLLVSKCLRFNFLF